MTVWGSLLLCLSGILTFCPSSLLIRVRVSMMKDRQALIRWTSHKCLCSFISWTVRTLTISLLTPRPVQKSSSKNSSKKAPSSSQSHVAARFPPTCSPSTTAAAKTSPTSSPTSKAQSSGSATLSAPTFPSTPKARSPVWQE